MTRQQVDIRETARKLRRLTTSPNAHEAARAREKYQAYTAQHRISLEDEPVFPEHEPVFPPALTALRRNAEELQRVAHAWRERDAATAAAARELQATIERLEIEYLRRLPQGKREESLRRLPPAKRAEYRRQFEVLRRPLQSKRRAAGRAS